MTACAVRIYTPNPAVEVPELRGERGVKISTDLVGAHQFRATDDVTARPLDLDHPNTTTAFDVFPGFSVAPFSRLEAGVELSPFHGTLSGVMKFQILGAGTRHADVGNIPLTLYVRTGQGTADTGDTTVSSGSGASTSKGKIGEAYLHAGISTGYRVTPHVLIFGGVAGGQYWAHAQVDQSADGVNPAGSYSQSYRGNATTVGGGALFNWRVVQFFVGGEVTHIDYDKSREQQDMYLHMGVTFTPGGSQASAPAAPAVE